MPTGVKKHHGLHIWGQYPKRPQGGNVITQVCPLFWLLPLFLFLFMPLFLCVSVLLISLPLSALHVLPFLYLP